MLGEQLAAAGEQRLAVLRIARQRLQPARLPVDPGGVLLLGRRHRVDRLHDLLPAGAAVVGAQRGARLPGQRVVGELDLAAALAEDPGGAQELVGGLGLQLDRGLARDAGPGVRRELGRQGALPAIGEQAGGRLAVGRGEARQRQRGQLGIAARRRAGLLGEIARRAVDDLGHRRARRVGDERRRLARGARLAGLDAGARPSSRCRPASAAWRRAGSRRGRRSRRRRPSAPARRRAPASRTSLPESWSLASAKHVTSRSSFMRKRGYSAANVARSRRRTSSSSQSLRRRSST